MPQNARCHPCLQVRPTLQLPAIFGEHHRIPRSVETSFSDCRIILKIHAKIIKKQLNWICSAEICKASEKQKTLTAKLDRKIAHNQVDQLV